LGHGEDGRSDESGDTLVEVLLALIVLSLASVAVIVAFSTTISASAEHRSLTTFNTMIRSATEQATQQVQGNSAVPFNNCAPLSYYQAGIGKVTFSPPPSGTNYTAAITNVSYWNGSAGFVSGPTAMALCNSTYPNSPQEITVTITDPNNSTSYSNSFVVDDSIAVPPVPVCASNLTANALAFSIQPSGAQAGLAFTVQPQVWVENNSGSVPCVVTSDLSPVKLAITAGTGQSGANLLNCFAATSSGSGVVSYQNCAIDLGGNTAYTLTATDNNGALTVNSSSFYVIAQLANPVVTAATTSNNGPNAITVTFTPPSNAQAGQLYSAEACQTSAMTGATCVNQASITSNTDITGLSSGGAGYYVEVTAKAGNGFLASTSAAFGPATASGSQIGDPGTPILAYGASAGSINVTFPGSSPSLPGETYSAEACQNSGMTGGTCVNLGSITSGSDFTGLAYTPGTAGANYYVVVTANADDGFTANPSVVSAAHADTSQVSVPIVTLTKPSGNPTGRITISFTTGTGVASDSVTGGLSTPVTSQNSATINNYVSGTSYSTGQPTGTTIYLYVTAQPSAGFVSNVSATVNGKTN